VFKKEPPYKTQFRNGINCFAFVKEQAAGNDKCLEVR